MAKNNSKKSKFEIVRDGVVLKSNSIAGSFDNLTLSEIRLFCIYLAKINPSDKTKNEIKFSLEEYCKILGITEVKKERLQYSADKLLKQLVTLKIDEAHQKGICRVQMFSKLKIYFDDKEGNWFVSLKAHEDIMPFLFNQQKNFLQYKLWNVFKLNSSNQIVLYEILKSKSNGFLKPVRDMIYFPKEITVDLTELKETWFGFKNNEYPEFKIFKRDVLNVCQQAINEYTDIKFTYTPKRSSSRGKPVNAITFFVERNKKYEDVFQIEELMSDLNIQIPKEDYTLCEEVIENPKKIELTNSNEYEKCINIENEKLLKENIKLALQDIYSSESIIQARTEEIFKRCVTTFKINSKSTVIKSPMAYMQGIINNLVDDERKNPKKEKRRSYDISQFESFAINYDELQKVYEKEKMD